MKALIITTTVAVALSFGAGIAEADSASDDMFRYTVKRGDTCIKIAKRVLGDRRGYRIIHRHNRKLGPLPHKLRPGSTLLLPRPGGAAPDARVTRHRGAVDVRPAQKSAWHRAKRNMGLFRSWRVNSKKRSTAELTFRDKSKIYMRDNTLVIIYGRSNNRSKLSSTTAQLERGTLRARLADLDGAKVDIRTGTTVASVKGSDTVVSVSDGVTRVANHRGKAARVRSTARRYRRRSVRVKRGMGTKVKKGKPPSKPKPLPPTPAWKPGPDRFAAWSHVGGSINAGWSPQTVAAAYRVEVSRDAAATDVLATVTVSAKVDRFELHRLPAGVYYARIATIGPDKFESIPSQARKLEVVAIKLAGAKPSFGAALDPMAGKPAPTILALGTHIDVPPGMKCTLAGTSSDKRLLVSAAGQQTVSCTDSAGGKAVALPIVVAEVAARVESSAGHTALPRNQQTTLVVALESKAALASEIWVKAPEGVTVQARPLAGGKIELVVQPSTHAPKQATLQLMTGDRSQPVALTTVSLAIAALPPPAPAVVVVAPVAPKPTRFEVGLFAGGELFPFENGLGNANSSVETPLGPSSHLGVRLGYSAHRRLIIEAETSLGRADIEGTDASGRVFSLRLQARIPVLARGRLSPFLLGGAAVRTLTPDTQDVVAEDTDAAGHLGLGANLRLGKRGGLRLDARQLITSDGSGGVSTSFEGQLGVFTRF